MSRSNADLVLVARLLAKLTGPQSESWTKRLEELLHEDWPIFRTIEIGTCTDQQSLHSAVERSGAKITRWAADLLPRTPLSDTKTPVELMVASVEELGYPSGTRLKTIYATGAARGWQLCPAEIGPQLAIQYVDQPVGEFLIVAMEPIIDSARNPLLFAVPRHPHGRSLSALALLIQAASGGLMTASFSCVASSLALSPRPLGFLSLNPLTLCLGSFANSVLCVF